jgi:ketosteroid isomerase-like protein
MAMTPEQNKRIVSGIWERMARGETIALADAMTDDFRWVFPGVWTWAGEWGPKDVARTRLLRPLMRQFSSYASRADLVLADGDHVVVQARATATTVRGDAYPQTYCFILRMHDGGIAEIVEHCDTALVERVLERPAA